MARTQLLEELYFERPWLDRIANDDFILVQAKSQPGKHDITSLRQAADLLGTQPNGKLLLAEAYANAWQTFIIQHPEYTGPGCYGNQAIVFNRLNDGEQNPTVEMFEAIAQQTTPAGIPILAESNTHVGEQAQQRERANFIQEISKGNSIYWSFDKWSRRASFQTSDLENMPTDELKVLAARIADERRLQNLPPDQRRLAIREIANATPGPQGAVRELPKEYTCTVPSGYGYAIGQKIELTRIGFCKLGRDDQRIILNTWGIPAVNRLLKPELA